MVTLELLKEDLSIESVAKQRGLTLGSIVSHIDKLKGLKLIDSAFMEQLKNTIPKETFDAIFAEFKKSEDGKLTAIYEHFEGAYSYNMLRLVRLFAGG